MGEVMPRDPEKVREWARAWYKANREKVLEWKRAQYKANAEKEREMARGRYKANPEKKREREQRCMARLLNLAFQHYGDSCRCCGERDKTRLETDHLDPYSSLDRHPNGRRQERHVVLRRLKRDGWPQGQVQILCDYCNRRKRQKPACPCSGLGDPKRRKGGA